MISDVARALSALVTAALPTGAVVRLGAPGRADDGVATADETDGTGGALAADGTTADGTTAAGGVDTGHPEPARAVWLALRWVRDDTSGRLSGTRDVRADDGSLLGRQGPPRRYELQFAVSATAPTAAQEYELLDAVLLAVTGLDAIPAGRLPAGLVETGLPVLLSVSAAPAAAGAVAPGLTLLVSVPVLPPIDTELAPPAAEMAMGLRRSHRVPPPATASANGDRRWRRATVDES